VAAVHGSPWFIGKGKLGGGGDQRSGVGGTAEGPGERVVGALVVRMRVKDKALGSAVSSPRWRRGGDRRSLGGVVAHAK
jgi:hypothetical protein